ncbi:MAG TPA: tetratricopeptide repeat protein [Terriglobia bacterium]|nr:tetratricopeptide repeat protein [Terriglobia bacterium]
MKHSYFTFLFAFGIAIWLSAAAWGPPLQANTVDLEAREHFRAALRAQKSGQWDAAVREYQAALHLEPQMAEAYANLGLVYYLQSKFEKSSQSFAKAAALKPGLRGADLFLGMDYVHLHRSQNAVPYLTRAAEAEPENKQAQVWLGTALWNSGERAAALLQLRKAARLFPTDVDALYALGEAYQKSAEQQLEKLPRKYGQMLRKGASPQEWKGSGALVPGRPLSGPYEQALAGFERKDYAAAEAKLTAFLAANPKSAKARYLLATTYEHLSLSVLSRMFQLDPDSYRVHQLMGRIDEYKWQNEKALAEYRTVEQMRPALPGLHLVIGEVLWREGKLDPALTEFRAEIKLSPYDARPYAEMGTILVTRHQSARAIPYLIQALHLQHDLLLARKQLGAAYSQQKQYAKAEEELKKALPIDHDGSIHYLLGVVYRDSGHPKQAKAEMEKARVIQAASERRAEVKTEGAAESKPLNWAR